MIVKVGAVINKTVCAKQGSAEKKEEGGYNGGRKRNQRTQGKKTG
jgi:hypothetical protein